MPLSLFPFDPLSVCEPDHHYHLIPPLFKMSCLFFFRNLFNFIVLQIVEYKLSNWPWWDEDVIFHKMHFLKIPVSVTNYILVHGVFIEHLYWLFNSVITSATKGGRRLCFHHCLSVCEQDIFKSYGRIRTKLDGQVGYVTSTNWWDFGCGAHAGINGIQNLNCSAWSDLIETCQEYCWGPADVPFQGLILIGQAVPKLRPFICQPMTGHGAMTSRLT